MSYADLAVPKFHKTATVQWAQQVGTDFEAVWTDKPRFSYFNDADRSVPTSTLTQAAFPEQRYQVGDFTEALGEYFSFWYVPRAGYYLCSLNVDWEANTAGIRQITIATYLETMTSTEKPDSTTGYCSQALTTVMPLAKGDMLTCGYWQNSGTTLDVQAGSADDTYKQDFSAVWIGDYDYL